MARYWRIIARYTRLNGLVYYFIDISHFYIIYTDNTFSYEFHYPRLTQSHAIYSSCTFSREKGVSSVCHKDHQRCGNETSASRHYLQWRGTPCHSAQSLSAKQDSDELCEDQSPSKRMEDQDGSLSWMSQTGDRDGRI